ncbi:MAG: hypothetical protein RIR26_2778 [Pseudomonadota bacterium]|jgi:16S rRNA (adenine1518-N6/adenine1519-N6)-dimethyltransferase
MKNNKKLARGEHFAFELETNKRLGQNFLKDESILSQIVGHAEQFANKSQRQCIEIGPGSGALTRKLLAAGWHVHAIEKDARAVAGLRSSLALEYPSTFAVSEADILQTKALPMVPEASCMPLCIGNIPYYITSDILFWFLAQQKNLCAGVFMVQKEVAERLAAGPGHKDYGRLTVRMQLACTVEQVLVAPASAFVPPPKVDSAVVSLVPWGETPLRADELALFEKFTAFLFSARRKMLRKTLQQAKPSVFGQTFSENGFEEFAEKAQRQLSVSLTQRPEELPPPQILELFRLLREAH